MRVSRIQYYEVDTLGVGELSEVLRSLFATLVEGPLPRVNVAYDLPDGTEAMEKRAPTDLDEICDLDGYHIWGSFHTSDGTWFSLNLVGASPGLRVEVYTDDAARLSETFDHLATHLSLTESEPPDEDATESERVEQELGELALRVGAIEALMSRITPTLRCFLSYRFGDPNELVALKVQRFLTLLGVEVITGQGYEPRSLSEKLSARLEDSVDFLVLLVQADGESPWTRDEIVTARARGAPVIPLVEEGAAFSPAIFGDLEYVTYASGHIGDTFLALTEAVIYIRSERKVEDAGDER
jgi:hypothetical protein